jgi:hypothetical protein
MRVKKVNGYYTLETKDRAEKTELLCDQCGISDCSIRAILNRVKINRYNAKLSITKCQAFLPSLDFRDAKGMEDEFNTFRLGGAWGDRLEAGQMVNLRSTKGEVIGVAEVTGVHKGVFTEMSKRFGADNHLSIDAEVNGQEFNLGKVMTECYGGHRFNVNSIVTVIEMRRVHGAGEKGEEDLRRVS